MQYRSILVAFAIYASWLASLIWHEWLPMPVLMIIGGIIVCWHGSLQHEALHGLIFTDKRLNHALAYPPISIWLPYPIYRDSHLVHHDNRHLTDPRRDPESYYISRDDWEKWPEWRRRIVRMHHTVAGRLTLGPLLVISQFWASELRAILQGDNAHLRTWIIHAIWVVAILAFAVLVCGLPLWMYLLCYVWPGASLMLLRSFAEHEAEEAIEHRTAVVEASLFFRLLYLNNNFHAVHHERPSMPWHQLRAHYAETREDVIRRNGGLLYRGYGDILRRYLFRMRASPEHPFL